MSGAAEAQAAPLNETELAEEVAAGRLPSGFPCAGYRLWALRISGTGPASRPAHGEIALRDAGTWLSPEMIRRCTGLPVVIEHPPSGQLDGDSFAQRVVGMVMLPYPRDGELWGVAKVFDASANEALAAGLCSTSPSVTFAAGDGSQTLDLGEGKRLHLEGDPARVDHLALVPDAGGVWDRGVPGRGVRADSIQHGERTVSETMSDSDNAPPDPVMAALNKLTDCITGMASKQESMASRLDGLCSRMDSMEKAGQRDPGAPPDSPMMTAADSFGSGRLTLQQARQRNMELADAQSRADKCAVEFNQRAEPPMMGETPIAYRLRLLRPFRKYSEDYKSIDVDAINDPALLDIVEQRVYADAAKAARNCEHLPDDGPHPVHRTDETGRRITTWHGRRTFIANMKPGLRRASFRPSAQIAP